MKPFFFLIILSFAFALPAFANDTFFDRADQFFKTHVQNGLLDYGAIHDEPEELQVLTDAIAQMNLTQLDADAQKAFYINAYNLLVIKGALDNYPLESVLATANFFDRKNYIVAGEKMSLNELEKQRILPTYNDPRLHFVLVCGALGCPPITDFAYRPEQLEQQLEQQTRLALNDPNFIRVNAVDQRVLLSQIFEWYQQDFGRSKRAAVKFINRYRAEAIPADWQISFYEYDWSLNEQSTPALPTEPQESNNAFRYVVSSTIPKGTTETKIFNNLYTQVIGGDLSDERQRTNFFTTFVTSLYGVSDRLNVGLEVRYRQSTTDRLPASPLDVFRFEQSPMSRFGMTTIGPKVRYAPFEQLPNFSVQSAFWIPLRDDWEGTADRPFLDWNNPTWWTQFFNDFSIGENFALFAQVDALWEDIGNSERGAFNRFSTPITVIGSYFPNPKTTVYVLTNYSPFWTPDVTYFGQAGLGAKYQFTRNFELEALYSYFTDEFLMNNNGRASTFNIGIRINR